MATILVVDDELGIRALLSEILSDEGHNVEVAENAAKARILRERGSRYSVLRLRGYLFFGSIVGLVNDIRRRIRDSHVSSVQPLRVLVLDFRYVNGMDSSTALTLVKLRQPRMLVKRSGARRPGRTSTTSPA